MLSTTIKSQSLCCAVISLLCTVLVTAKPFQSRSPKKLQSIQSSKHILRRDDPDYEDLSYIKNFASIGDSYAAGIGAGARLTGSGDWSCSRYSNSFPALVNAAEELGDPAQRKFSNIACSGAVTDDAIKQVNGLGDGSQDLITISSGGNDAKLADILDECIFQWSYTVFPWIDHCNPTLDTSQAIIDSDDFHSKLDQLISSAKSKLTADGAVYYVGYPRFFGVEDNQCDSVTWSFFKNAPFREYLTLDHRKRMNALVINMNKAISDAVSRAASDNVIFVDYDKYYESTVGRFCEAGYPESNQGFDSGNREGLLIFQYHTAADPTGPSKRADAPAKNVVANGTLEAKISDWVRDAIKAHPELEPTVQVDNEALSAPPPSTNNLAVGVKATGAQMDAGLVLSILPDAFGRIFHPRSEGHALIANLVLYKIFATRAKKLGVDVPVEEATIDTCPAATPAQNPDPTPTPEPGPTNCTPNFECPEPGGPVHRPCRVFNCSCDNRVTVPYINNKCKTD